MFRVLVVIFLIYFISLGVRDVSVMIKTPKDALWLFTLVLYGFSYVFKWPLISKFITTVLIIGPYKEASKVIWIVLYIFWVSYVFQAFRRNMLDEHVLFWTVLMGCVFIPILLSG